MKTLKHWTLESRNADGITLRCDEKHLLHVIVLEEHIWRVWLLKNGASTNARSWLVSPPDAPIDETGRERASRAGFTCPNFELSETADTLILSGKTLRLEIRRPLQLIWYKKDGEQWREIAADRATGAYELSRQGRNIAHYMYLHLQDRYFGLGEKAGTLDRFGKKYEMRSLDAMGYNAESTDPLYKHWPFYQTLSPSGAHWGIFYDNLNTSRFDMGNEIDNYHLRYRSYRAEGGDIDYYFLHGDSIADITKAFLQISGKNLFPPKWSLGYSGSTMSYTDADNAQEQLYNFTRLCQEHAIPCDSFQLSSGYTSIAGKRYVFNWNTDKFPDFPQLAADFRAAGIRFAANIKPCLLQDHPKYQEVAAAKLFIQDSESDNPEQSMFWNDTGSHLDFTNPATGKWWRDNIKSQLLDKGISSTWNDNNEYEIWDDEARCQGFGNPIAIHHIRPLMPLLMTQNSYQAQIEYSAERPYLISRSGCPGIQRYAQTWSGDNRTSWHSLKWNIRMGVGMSLSGMYHIGHDIGGFAGGKPDAELFLRWIQSALLLPRFTIHSWNDDHSVNEPWMYPQITHAVRDAIRLRYRLIPFLYTLLWQTHSEDEAYLRPTFLDHEHDPRTFEDTDDHMIGKELLVCPVTAEGVRKREVYLPDNSCGWYDYYSSQYHSGGQSLEVAAPLEHLPIFVRAGSIIPEGSLMHADSPEDDSDRLRRLFPQKANQAATGVIYDDDGTDNSGKHYLLRWEMQGDGEDLHIRIQGEGEYRPAWLDNISLELPFDEGRRIVIDSNLNIQL